MTDLSLVEAGRARRATRAAQARQIRRRRRLRRGLLVLTISVGLFGILVGVIGSTPRQIMTNRLAAAHQLTLHHSFAPPPYGRVADALQVDPRLTLALKSGLLFDIRTGRVLWAKDPEMRRPIASLTKMMTALVVVAHSKPSDRVLITRQAIDFTGSGVGLLPRGKRVPEKALLYGLLLPSGNDAAIALAQHVAGTQARFITLMNRHAGAMHLACTHYATVSGVTDRDNYSCASDLAVLAHAVLTQPVLAPIVATRNVIMPFPIKGGKLYLNNNNPLLAEHYPGADGVKTGFTDAAGLCIVAAARQGHSWLGVVLLHSGNWATQAETLLNAGFAAEAQAAARRRDRSGPG